MDLVRTTCIDSLTSITAAPERVRVIEVRAPEAAVQRVLVDVRARIERGDRTVVTADHMRALGLDRLVRELARVGE